MQADTDLPRAAGVAGAVMAGDIIEPLIKPGSGEPTTPRPPSYDQPQSDPGDEDQAPPTVPVEVQQEPPAEIPGSA
jgi:hypothetical protein